MLPIVLLVLCAVCLAVGLLIVARAVNPIRPGPVKRMPYESGMDPIHDARRRFDVRFFLLAIAFLVFDVEILFLYPWAAAFRTNDEHRMLNDELPIVAAAD
ncbi:MAG: NAD(P)H-quinone oxidoreductase subunit 3, partial [Pirellulaceae bacterium]|nr:NAD(P)H-quinone oxidoreductase subunit 3 [Pirellulaceae bacterium]